MDYSSVPKEEFLYPERKPDYESQSSNKCQNKRSSVVKGFKCCCCRCTKKRFCKICCLATFGPIILLGAALGIYILIQRLTYNPPPVQISNSNDTMIFLVMARSQLTNNVTLNNSTNGTKDVAIVEKTPFDFQTSIHPPWSDCGSQLAKVHVVSIEVCNLQESRCVFTIEQDWTLEVAFTMKPNITVAEPNFHVCGKAIYLGTPCRTQPFNYPYPCNSSNIECPLNGGQNYLYRNVGGVHQKDLPVKIVFETYADVYFRMKDPISGKNVFCLRIPAIIRP